MSVDAQKEQVQASEMKETQGHSDQPSLLDRLRASLAQVDWRRTVLTSIAMAAGWCILFLSFNIFQILAGIVPVTAGLYLGKRVQQDHLLHGILLGLIGFVVGLLIVSVYGALGNAGYVALPQATNPETEEVVTLASAELISFYLSFSALAIIPFPAFGAVMAGRTAQRQREMREQVEARGGKLEKPSVVRTLEDVQGLSLPQFGTYVSNLFKRNGFTFHDYRFLDKDKHLDLEMVYQDEIYLLRLSVADKVQPGTIETLAQDMKRREIGKGLVVTSTEFTSNARKSVKNRANMVLIDGQTLFDIAEG